MTNNQDLKKTVLNNAHRRLKAKLVPFAGWEMPIQYAGITQEHLAVRNDVGLFDVSHMGQVQVSGRDSLAFLQALLPQDIGRLKPGKLLYTVLCNSTGGIMDDLQVWRLGDVEYLLVINASRTTADLQIIQEMANNFTELDFKNVTAQRAMIAVQGPKSGDILDTMSCGKLTRMGWYNCQSINLAGEDVLISRSGYTGEFGYEIICPAAAAERIWNLLVEYGGTPCGLGARDTLRTEAGLCLYGNELSETINPFEAGLGWTIKLNKEQAFLGKEALVGLKEEGPKRQLIGIVLEEKGIPRPGYTLLNLAEQTIGTITSGGFSPTIQKGIAMAMVEIKAPAIGDFVQVDMRGRYKKAYVVDLPFVPSRIRKG
jgi:aminomethyltransferase